MIKYIGSKRTLLPKIVEAVSGFENVRSVLDPFSGTSRVGHALKGAGYRVVATDHNAYAATLARCYVQCDLERQGKSAQKLIDEIGSLPGKAGYFTETFCVAARYVHPKNGERIDAMREAIASKCLDPELEAVVLTSLMEAADRVDSTTGVQMAYLKQWSKRAHKDLSLRLPALLPRAANGPGLACVADVEESLAEHVTDLVYLDPPYNQHSYLGNYHVWESLVRWDKPEVYGIACKRIDCRERKSDFNSKRKFRAAFTRLLAAVQSKYLIVSFSDEGFLARDELEALLATVGDVSCQEIDYKRYVGAQIGVHNFKGEKVGTVSHLRNKELIFSVLMRGYPATVTTPRWVGVTRGLGEKK